MNTLGTKTELESNTQQHYDVMVVGAGIHGASMACEAASRGLSTILVQAGQLMGTASCAPSDIQGAGLNQLENIQIPDVMNNHEELSRLHHKAPHLVRPIESFFVRNPKIRSERKLRLGSRIYNRLQGISTPKKNQHNAQAQFNQAVLTDFGVQEYSVNYMRLAIALLQEFQSYTHTRILSNHTLTNAVREQHIWDLGVESGLSKKILPFTSKVIINCTGCHSSDLLKEVLGVSTRSTASRLNSAYLFINLSQQWDSAAIFQRPNKSLVYAHNLDNAHICLGPILAEDDSDIAKNRAIDECLSLWNQNTQLPITRHNIVHCRWSSHPLAEDPSKHKLASTNNTYLDLNNPGNAAPLLTLFGNNLVRYRKLAEQGLDILSPFTNAQKDNRFVEKPYPGGNFNEQKVEHVITQLCAHYPFLNTKVIERLVHTYGTNALEILNACHEEKDMGEDFGHGLYTREVNYLIEKEWATTADDILWRRTYLGLQFSEDETQKLAEYLSQQ